MIFSRTSIGAMVLLLAPVALSAANGLPSPDNGQARAIPLSGAAFVPPDAIFSDRFEQP